MSHKSEPSPPWKAFQREVARLLRTHGFEAREEAVVAGARGKHRIDILATLPAGELAPVLVVECKHWNRPASKNVALEVYGVVQDIGATCGILVTTRGVDPGCRDFLSTQTNVRVVDIFSLQSELEQLMVQGFSGFAFAFEAGMKAQLARSLRCEPSDIDYWPPIVLPGNAGKLCIAESKPLAVFIGLDFTGVFPGNWSSARTGSRTAPTDLRDVHTGKPIQAADRSRLMWLEATASADGVDDLKGARLTEIALYSVRGKWQCVMTQEKNGKKWRDYPAGREAL